MAKRKISCTLTCHHPGCKETGFTNYDNQREYLSGSKHRDKWMCVRHLIPGEVLSIERPEIVTELVSQQKVGSDVYWDGRWGLTHGDGYKAFAGDFPVGTKLIVTARIVLPGQ